MSEQKEHTPGPWQWRETMTAGSVMGRDFFVSVRLGGAPDGSGRVLGADSVSVADARLIAAAPTLVEALEKIIEMNRQRAEDEFADADKAEGWACVRVAREAIAQAKGA